MTRSMACSKCFWLMASERWRAAIRAASLQTLAMSAPGRTRAKRRKLQNRSRDGATGHHWTGPGNSPENPGVSAAIFLARMSLSRSGSSFRGRRWTLKMDARPLMSGGPEEVSGRGERSARGSSGRLQWPLSYRCKSVGQSVRVSSAPGPECLVGWFLPGPPRWWPC